MLMPSPVRVALVDDHPLWREGVAATLAANPLFEIVGQGASTSEAVQLVADLLPDLIFLDISMPGGGLNAASKIATDYPVTKIIMLTVSQDEDTVFAALKAGARGYVLKGVSGSELVAIALGVHNGETYITPALATAILVDNDSKRDNYQADDPISNLNKRERQILEQVALGHSNRQIATNLSLSEKTIKHYMTNVLQKLQVRNRVEAALMAKKVL